MSNELASATIGNLLFSGVELFLLSMIEAIFFFKVKDELSGTVDTLHQVESTSTVLQKNKEKYHQLCMEAEKLRKATAPAKEIEKVNACATN